MTRLGGATALTAVLLAAGPAAAGAWPMPKGEGQAILKYERRTASQGYDRDGLLQPLPQERRDESLSLFVEYGLTPRLTLQGRVEAQRGSDAFVDYQGAGPAEIGLRALLFETPRTAVSLYGGYAHPGDGRNAGYAAPGEGEGDWEVRLLAGRSGETRGRWIGGRAAFAEVQAARVFRSGLPDETRLDATAGLDLGSRWSVLIQGYGGRADDDGAAWAVAETSLMRRIGGWRIQAGWRTHLAGRETPAGSGPVLAVWRRF